MQTNKISLYKQNMRQMKICIIIPTYNNQKTICDVIDSVLPYCEDIIVINDGSTDGTGSLLKRYETQISTISYERNRGKGYALRKGFQEARRKGFNAAITIDSDGQHRADDLQRFTDAYSSHLESLIIGVRSFDNPNMPLKNSFANRFSNFWFLLQTGKKIDDTQTGFRLYPIKSMGSMLPFNNRYEAEYELLVRCAWRNIKIIPLQINVYYPPKDERISHFRPTLDFIRISLLNTLLTVVALIYGYISMAVRKKS